MAKASAQITLHYVIDVQAYYRYYILRESTLAKPSKPTTFPPSSSWDDTEPTYVDGSTKSLYFVDCTVFCDNTFTYSEVSLSSSYEAAKIAYNKAVSAQNTADDANKSIEDNVGTLNQTISDKTDEITDAYQAEIDAKLEDYVDVDTYNDDKDDILAQLNVANGQIDATFTRLDGQDDDIGGVQDGLNNLLKRITLDANGITISGGDTGDNKLTLHIDNDGIVFRKNGTAIGLWDGDDFYTGNIFVKVSERATFGTFSYVPRSDGSLSFLMTGQTTLPVVTVKNNVMTVKNTKSLYNGNIAVITDIPSSISGTMVTLEV